MHAARLLALALALLLPFASARGTEKNELGLTFGVYTSDKPTDMFRAFKPTLVYLEDALGKLLSKKVTIKLRVFNSYDAARTALVSDEVDFVRFGPSSYILAKDENPNLVLLVMEKQEGSFTFQGVIFARKDSGIETIADIRGKSFAFGDSDSTIGRYLSQTFLVDQRIYAKDLSKYQYLGRHDRVVAAVLSGSYDAGAAKESSFLKAKDQGLKALVTFDNVTKPWVARSKLDPSTVDSIRKALLSLEDRKVLDAMNEKVTGFAETKDEMYHGVRVAMKKADEFVKGPPRTATAPLTNER